MAPSHGHAGHARLGSQIWLEPDDSDDRIDALCRQARDAGLGWLRIIFMWPWIEPEPGRWDWRIYDAVFAAAQRHGLRIKVTLTANSGPWHVGTPSALHSFDIILSDHQRDAAARYIEQCVARYAAHPALGQWILWNEPDGRRIGKVMGPPARAIWADCLRELYGDDIARLNRRWRTGFDAFEGVPFTHELLHEAAGEWTNWASYGPRLAEWRFKARYLNHDLRWVADRVRALDPATELCVNPTSIHENGAWGANDIPGMAAIVDVLGASYHPAWSFGFADRADFPALMNTGVRLQAARAGVRRVEVTEVQTGNTLKSSNRPCDAAPDEILRFHLASLAAGAESVTGWCLNARSRDFEAGDWALLDDLDGGSIRSRAMRDLSDRLDAIHRVTGPWARAPAAVFVVSDPRAHALEWIEDKVAYTPVPGRMCHDGAHGAAKLGVAIAARGLPVDIVGWDGLPEDGAGKAAIVSHVVAIEARDAERLERFVASGGRLLIDATSGHKTGDAELWRPWPGGLADAFGVRVVGMESDPAGWAVTFERFAAASFIAARSHLETAPGAGWTPVPGFRFAADGDAFAIARDHGAGRVTLCRGLIGPSLVHQPATAPLVDRLLAIVLGPMQAEVVPFAPEPGLWTTPISIATGSLTLVLAPSLRARGGRDVGWTIPAGTFTDLWGGGELRATPDRPAMLPMPQGIALLHRA